MKKTLALTLTLTLLTSLFPGQPAVAQCARGNNRSTAYIQRDNDKRCEGLAPQRISSSFELVSLAIGKIATPQEKYALSVPNYRSKQPKVRIRSIRKNYQLDPLGLTLSNNKYLFHLIFQPLSMIYILFQYVVL